MLTTPHLIEKEIENAALGGRRPSSWGAILGDRDTDVLPVAPFVDILVGDPDTVAVPPDRDLLQPRWSVLGSGGRRPSGPPEEPKTLTISRKRPYIAKTLSKSVSVYEPPSATGPRQPWPS